ncbi:MAG: hypothetical protein GXY23_00935 [Myxococcales bacterium]|nr:hypothetical protein [Myxococcales bacterium]
MYSIALVTIFGIALFLGLLAAAGMFLVGAMEKRTGAPVVPAATRSASVSSDVTLYVRAEGEPADLFGGHPVGERKGLLRADELHAVCASLAERVDRLRDAAVIYAAPTFYAPYDDGQPGTHYRLRVRTRKPVRTIAPPISRDALRDSLREIAALDSEALIAAHLETVTPKRDRALPKLEGLV